MFSLGSANGRSRSRDALCDFSLRHSKPDRSLLTIFTSLPTLYPRWLPRLESRPTCCGEANILFPPRPAWPSSTWTPLSRRPLLNWVQRPPRSWSHLAIHGLRHTIWSEDCDVCVRITTRTTPTARRDGGVRGWRIFLPLSSGIGRPIIMYACHVALVNSLNLQNSGMPKD